ncbi:MAG: hydantoinase/oxoprolinase family protein, partial [Aestuariivirgaceae bacterium]
RAFCLMPFGGAGGLHAHDVAREMGIGELLVPLAPGILCAEGLVASDLKEDFVATCRTPLDDDLTGVRAALVRLRNDAGNWFRREAVAAGDRGMTLIVDMRYIGQNYELGVAIAGSDSVELPAVDELERMFYAEHQRAYGHFDPDAPVEVINLRLTAIGRLPGRALSEHGGRSQGTAAASRSVWFDDSGATETAIWHRDALPPGSVVKGPAVVEQFDATTLVPPGATARIDDAANMIIGLDT